MENPYAPPAADPATGSALLPAHELATLGDRFAASLVDGLINLAVIMALIYLLIGIGVFANFGDYANSGLVVEIAMVAVSYGTFLAIHSKFMRATGQTVGKRLMKIRVVTMDGGLPDFGDQAFKRYGFMHLVSAVPLVGSILSLVNILFIFRADRRCIHDLLANTRVVKAAPIPEPQV